MNNFLQIENRHTGEILRMRRVRDAGGQIILTIEGSLPPGSAGPPLHVHFHQREEGTVNGRFVGSASRKREDCCALWRERSFSRWSRAQVVECRQRLARVKRPVCSGRRPGSLSSGAVRGPQRQFVRQAIDLLHSTRHMEASAHTVGQSAAAGSSANRVSRGSAGRPRPWQIPGR